MTLLFLALAVSQGEPTAALAATIVVIAVGMLLVARYAATVIRSRVLTVGARARQHRESLTRSPEPQHPSTPGRPLTRAPATA